jgi:hypothetical protein
MGTYIYVCVLRDFSEYRHGIINDDIVNLLAVIIINFEVNNQAGNYQVAVAFCAKALNALVESVGSYVPNQQYLEAESLQRFKTSRILVVVHALKKA